MRIVQKIVREMLEEIFAKMSEEALGEIPEDILK